MLAPKSPPDTLLLEYFVPFRLNRLAETVSVNLSGIYRNRFGLEIPEWRVLVTVGQREECTAQLVASSTRMHKTRVSRAVASLEARNLVSRSVETGGRPGNAIATDPRGTADVRGPGSPCTAA